MLRNHSVATKSQFAATGQGYLLRTVPGLSRRYIKWGEGLPAGVYTKRLTKEKSAFVVALHINCLGQDFCVSISNIKRFYASIKPVDLVDRRFCGESWRIRFSNPSSPRSHLSGTQDFSVKSVLRFVQEVYFFFAAP